MGKMENPDRRYCMNHQSSEATEKNSKSPKFHLFSFLKITFQCLAFTTTVLNLKVNIQMIST